MILDTMDVHVRRGAGNTNIFHEGAGEATLGVDVLPAVSAEPIGRLLLVVKIIHLIGLHLLRAYGDQREVLISCQHHPTAGMHTRAVSTGSRFAGVRAGAQKAAMMGRRMDQ